VGDDHVYNEHDMGNARNAGGSRELTGKGGVELYELAPAELAAWDMWKRMRPSTIPTHSPLFPAHRRYLASAGDRMLLPRLKSLRSPAYRASLSYHMDDAPPTHRNRGRMDSEMANYVDHEPGRKKWPVRNGSDASPTSPTGWADQIDMS